MTKTTQLDRVKAVAAALLLTELNDTEFSPMIVQHPFTSSGVVAVERNGEIIMLNICQSEDDLKAWRFFMTERIKKVDSLYDIYSMINKPYALTFLKLASPFMSREDFSELLAYAWVRSENPNCDPNFMKNELVRMFKESDPDILMAEAERRY